MERENCAGPSKKRKLATFCDRWTQDQNYSSWIKKMDEYTAFCKLCQSEISVKYEGSLSLNKHLKTSKHNKIVLSQKLSYSISNFVTAAESKDESLVSKAELMFVYHNVVHGLSYNSLDCQIKLSSSIFCDSKIASKISCGRTKAAAIARNVLAPYSQETVSSALKESYFYSLSSDASNIGNVKTFPYAVKYFNADTGIRKQVLDFYEDHNEASKDIFDNIIRISNENYMKIEQITAYCADNAAVNYGVHNSVFQKLKNENKKIIKANCNCHVINNCVKKSLNALSVDVENIVIKTFNEFSSSALTNKKLKDCFEFANIEYKNLLRHVPTRWLSLLPAIDRLIYSWPAVKMYFLQKGKNACRKVVWEFVSRGVTDNDVVNDDEYISEGLSEAYLYFLHNVMHEFHSAVLALESDSCTIIELNTIMLYLLNNLKNRFKDEFYGSKVITILKKISCHESNTFKLEANQFLRNAVTYLEQRYDFGDNSLYNKISVLNLKQSLVSWNDLSELPKVIQISNLIDNDLLYTDFCCLREVFDNLPKNIPIDKIWSVFFQKCDKNKVQNLYKLVSFVLSIPISNAFCERTFSILNNFYSQERHRMSFDLIKAEILIRLNFNESCKDFQTFLHTNKAKELLNSVNKNTKYMCQKK